VAAAGAAFLVYTWLPNGDYEPIRASERWTIKHYSGASVGRRAAAPG
jgi:hypothetical protein